MRRVYSKQHRLRLVHAADDEKRISFRISRKLEIRQRFISPTTDQNQPNGFMQH